MLPLHDAPTESATVARSRMRVAPAGRKSSQVVNSRVASALADPSRVVFLDVETTGLSWYYDDLTMVGWACGPTYKAYVTGDNHEELLDALASAHTLVTFNGTLFDLRFLRKTFGDLVLPRIHIDLRYLSKRAGLTGGQKAIEQAIGLPARVGLEDVDGAAAVVLWHRYIRGDDASLSRLIEYNRYDVLGMCGILDEVMDRLDIHPDLLFRRPKFGEQVAQHQSQWLRGSQRRIGHGGKVPPTFDALFKGSAAESATVVGIDLTGSEARPSGWCVMRGREAVTCMVFTDDEMIDRVLAARPTVVSIDSPLSMPFGRVSVEDTDPGREEFGIMRRCERELKRRGINVYPSLLPSMQGLTKRGMNLAARIRSLGIPVMESYPGAAQDIMGIPRKGAGVEFLKQGLADFGIDGLYKDTDVTHDELDAITSAVVGSFFLAGRFEALCGPSEGALVIPDLVANAPKRLVVGISGRICAGKTTVARFLEAHGFAYTRFSLVIDDEIAARNEIPGRETRQRVGAEINQTKGQRWLCERVLDRVKDRDLVVIDGLRFPEDYAFFFEQFGYDFFHLHIEAPVDVRASRYASSESGPSFEVADSQPVEGQIDKLASCANITLCNNTSVVHLTDTVLTSIDTFRQHQSSECLSRLL